MGEFHLMRFVRRSSIPLLRLYGLFGRFVQTVAKWHDDFGEVIRIHLAIVEFGNIVSDAVHMCPCRSQLGIVGTLGDAIVRRAEK
jgi:hypothetical protein